MNNVELNTLSDILLAYIRRRPAHLYQPAYLARRLGCTAQEILRAADLLRLSHYDIAVDERERLAFLSAPDLLLAAEITHRLKTTVVGRRIYAYQTVQSTNTIASTLADAAVPEGSVVIAEAQTQGRGRLGRNWYSTGEKGIYLSIILYPDIDPRQAPGISMMTALSLADTIAALDDLEVHVKWPNDCLVNGRKVAGILTELSAEIGKVHYVIVGVGLNVNHRRRDFPEEIRKTATSLRAELKEPISRVILVQNFLRHFEKDYRRFQKGGLTPMRRRLLGYSNLLGKRVSLDGRGGRAVGTAVDIDADGSLIVETESGRQRFTAGDVTVVKR